MNRILLFLIFFTCSCRKLDTDPDKVGEMLCSCYQGAVAKKGLDAGIWYCDSVVMLKSRLYRIYREKYFGNGVQTYVSSSTLDSVYDFSSKLHFYIGEHCDGYFFETHTIHSLDIYEATDSMVRRP